MKSLYYTIQTLLRGRGSNVIKILSLTLGLFIGILLFAKIAFELNYNSDYHEPDRLGVIMAKYTISGVDNRVPSSVVMGPVPGAIAEEFPNEVEAATVFRQGWRAKYSIGDNESAYGTFFTDTLFFQTVGISVLKGNVSDLANPDAVFLSTDVARRFFGDDDPIGKSIMMDDKVELTVKGVFRPVGENNTYRPEVAISFAYLRRQNIFYYGWGGGDSYTGLLRLREGVDFQAVNSRIDAMIEKYMPYNPEKTGWGIRYEVWSAQEAYLKVNPELQTRLLIMGVLAFALLLVAALNYVLISISSLGVRAKAIGVYKCNGASTGSIFAMFVWETLILIGISLLLVVALIFSLRPLLEDLLDASIAGLFVWKAIWVPLLVVLFLFFTGAILPGKMFATIPVTQVFRRYTEGKYRWKHPLLFVQFITVGLIFGLLCVVMIQYRQLLSVDVGYQPEGLAVANYRGGNNDVVKSTLTNLPIVKDVSLSWVQIGDGWSGDFVRDGERTLFSTRFNYCDFNYAPLMGIKLKIGRNFAAQHEALVNEEYVRLMGWTDNPIGRRAQASQDPDALVVGVIEDFTEGNLYTKQNPILLLPLDRWQSRVTVRLKAPYRESLAALNRSAKEIFPTDNVTFTYLPDTMKAKYENVRRFRDTVLIAFACVLLITLIGLIGYVNDEVRRRSKEIAIRKVNGAEASDILRMLSKGITWVAVPAVCIGVLCAYYAGKEWLVQFEGYRMPLNPSLFILAAMAVLGIIFGTVIVKAWKIANDDPVKSIKNE